MIKDVLKEISLAEILDKGQIAKKLNITQALVEQAIEQLSRMGYVEEDMGSPACESQCNSCPMATSCNTTPLKTLSITEKGEKALDKM